MALILQRKPLSFLQRTYLWEILKGLSVTGKRAIKKSSTTKPIEDGLRSEHRLMLKDDGSIQCTACKLCATACPAQCIHITPGATEFSIDYARCTFCGLCVEACPCDALRMDTKKRALAVHDKKDLLRTIDYLKTNHGTKSPRTMAKL